MVLGWYHRPWKSGVVLLSNGKLCCTRHTFRSSMVVHTRKDSEKKRSSSEVSLRTDSPSVTDVLVPLSVDARGELYSHRVDRVASRCLQCFERVIILKDSIALASTTETVCQPLEIPSGPVKKSSIMRPRSVSTSVELKLISHKIPDGAMIVSSVICRMGRL